jgi:phosphoribosyl 1,2-cyclic phosphodiesterase
VLFTHEHADHTHGIDELRSFYLNQRKRVHVWANDRTGTMLLGRFGYCFYSPPGSDYPPILNLSRIVPEGPVEISGAGGIVEALPFEVEHGSIHALGFKVGSTAYTPDLNGIPDGCHKHLEGLDHGSSTRCAANRIRHFRHKRLPDRAPQAQTGMLTICISISTTMSCGVNCRASSLSATA